ncbi:MULTISPECIES: TolC family protein [unclassified Leptospira]|uniref:TolC family protein n=1 Tax=unclassified Leptospira TaxID=2633828 RepID=UPI0002BEB2C9|nr:MULTISPECIES: TolC family protein [unclassified Leptospira]EMK00360.1 outer membrane efflux protein [Leptospira sp. B5-022]MCR1793114.1 TolC family protein [Leptospira sp. id769339]
METKVVCSLSILTLLACSTPDSTANLRSSEENVRQTGYKLERNSKEKLIGFTADTPLADYLEEGIINNPEVGAAYFKWKESFLKSKIEGALEDPKLTFQADIKMTVMSFMPGLMLDLFGPGKRALRKDIALAEADADYYRYRQTVLRVLHTLIEIYYRYHLVHKKVEINKKMLRVLADIEKISRSGFEVGRFTLIDALRTQVEQSKNALEIRNLEDSENPLRYSWAVNLGINPKQEKVPFPNYIPIQSEFLESEAIYEVAFENNPLLKEMESEVRMAEKMLELANKSKVPDFAVGLMTDFATNPTMFRPTGFVTLPIWREKIEGIIGSSAAAKEGAKKKYTKELISLVSDFSEKLYKYREINRNLNALSKDFLPKIEKTFEVGLSGYSAGKIDFVTLLTIEREVLEFQIVQAELSVEREILIAEIKHLLMGIPLGKLDEKVLQP